jgi:hypothetical protein
MTHSFPGKGYVLGGGPMRRTLVCYGSATLALFVSLMATDPAVAGPGLIAGARPMLGDVGVAPKSGMAIDAAPTSFREVTAAFAATPTTGTLGDALEASRATFSTTEPVEFNAVVLESGLAGTTANLQLFIFDPRGRLAVGGFFVNGVPAPADRTGFFLQLSAGALPAGRFKWLMVIFDAFGNTFVTPFQALEIQ